MSKKRKILSEQRIFMQRTLNIFSNHKRKARDIGKRLGYTVDDLRGMTSKALGHGSCVFCHRTLTVKNFGVDHKRPLSRGGGMTFNNLLICCMACNESKGACDLVEWREILQVVNQWTHEMKTNFLARLRAGSRFAKLRRQQEEAQSCPKPPSPTSSPAPTDESDESPASVWSMPGWDEKVNISDPVLKGKLGLSPPSATDSTPSEST